MKDRKKTRIPRGAELLRDSMLNKGTGFTRAERNAFGLTGLLPPRVNSLETQVARVMDNVRAKNTDLEKYIYLSALQDRNKTLFYRALMDHVSELMPIVYTPTVGKVCQEYGRIHQEGTPGLYITAKDRGQVQKVLKHWPYKDVRIIVVTDGERILGLGDQGAGGMGIPVGKLMIYTACAGVRPEHCLPVTLDVGTNNETLLKDPFYPGMPERRLRGEIYDGLVDEFINAARKVFPDVLIQFEDFANHNAFRILQKYRDRVCSFNDDIQGTASVALAGLYSAVRILKQDLKSQRILFLGAGEAGLGIGNLVVGAMVKEGLTEQEARRRCFFIDSKGLIVTSRRDLNPHKRVFAAETAGVPDCLSAVKLVKPTAIVGVSGRPGTFTKKVLEAMAAINERPIVFAMSNPTSHSECTAEQAYRFTGGRAIFASGSPFAPVDYKGKRFVPGQGNNAYIFPGVGLGITACRVRRVTDEMFFAAAKALAGMVKPEDLAMGSIYPPLRDIRKVSLGIAVAVTEVAYARRLAAKPRPKDLKKYLAGQMYDPAYWM
ncbi:MAG TPA: NAD-dependent malic enzyme [Candidatus Omnitrophota bacterium]|jgi:malate dehydrogenase (oxaloacetate-decarboxylating)(NADP+)|nr:MAG: NAD-dependent malic enzyme [Candidatus Omnitrophica bacterium ADurb.Bin314]HQB94574.1 NAD-dependent malic enzyme [Candidatus Omnitrophota bacterium]